jgi:hypothetical protein
MERAWNALHPVAAYKDDEELLIMTPFYVA